MLPGDEFDSVAMQHEDEIVDFLQDEAIGDRGGRLGPQLQREAGRVDRAQSQYARLGAGQGEGRPGHAPEHDLALAVAIRRRHNGK